MLMEGPLVPAGELGVRCGGARCSCCRRLSAETLSASQPRRRVANAAG